MKEERKPRERFLALDTSTAVLAAALMENETVLSESNSRAERNHAVHVVQALEDLMKEQHIERSEIGGIAVGIGPGSYTGIRIAVTAAKTLAWAWDVPVAAVSSLEALAWGGLGSFKGNKGIEAAVTDSGNRAKSEQSKYWVVPLMDARRGQAYTAWFEGSDGDKPVHRLEEDGIRLVEPWTQKLAAQYEQTDAAGRPAGIIFAGDVSQHEETIEKLRERLSCELVLMPYDMEGRYVGKLGSLKLKAGQHDDVHTLIPNYTQLAEAEANLLRKG
ncbi:tRNA (adenosine(37)-N6)-threonylcarbamoyltransferase complex dimerization subunit type 1 TsaB [Paenibacillus sp. PDC88]|uniref:tRNA (adenosine(37)-N6)-threonylcarbamoyltransferase complex dimerization subunit type 1 TsaB n=1 Tax=Paenibacillus sp. PDC88 TaxID=1884375 RepID=UPI000898D5C1|nr:tRNA (adenosine(37)-N6)-threonylcarbamoyltransferase complex dimerization subunit type 1 TsaB [Paenibacillus sp. PDC88]SDX30863.1 tRNA threonylcarbamoyladenosine biosynthesis protein TsaB [Paenibacillus sp. PDC88]